MGRRRTVLIAGLWRATRGLTGAETIFKYMLLRTTSFRRVLNALGSGLVLESSRLNDVLEPLYDKLPISTETSDGHSNIIQLFSNVMPYCFIIIIIIIIGERSSIYDR